MAMNRAFSLILFLLVAAFAFSCAGKSEPATPVETLKAYTIAVKKKDVAMMKMLLSEASLKIHQEQAKAQNVSVDEIIMRETLFPESQRVFDYRNEKIEGDKSTVEVQNSFDGWDIVHLVREAGMWKIDKKGFSDGIINQNDEAEKKLDEQIEQERRQAEEDLGNSNINSNAENENGNSANDPAPSSSATPELTPNDAGDPAKATKP